MTNYAPDPGAEVEIVPRRSLELTLSDHQRLAEVASIVAGLLEIEPHDAGAVERLVGRVRSDDLADWLDTRWPAFRSSDRPVLVQVATILRRLAAGELDRHGVVDLKDYVLDHDLHVRIERVRATSSRSRV